MKITKNLIKYAEGISSNVGCLKNSIEEGDGNVAGAIGEIAALKKMGLTKKNLKSSKSFDYDIIDNDGITWDVKTKRRTVKPKPYYNCTVADYNTKQKCDRYLFVSLYNLDEAFVLGWITKEDFYKRAKFYNKGDYDPTSPNNRPFYFTADCYNVETKYLTEF